MDDIGLEKARKLLGEIVDEARIGNRRTLITRQGKPAAWVIGAVDLEDLESFKPQPMSQQCRDGLHCGIGDWRCAGCYCLCHLTPESPSVKQAWAESDKSQWVKPDAHDPANLRVVDPKEARR